jgi:hypothetical protein
LTPGTSNEVAKLVSFTFKKGLTQIINRHFSKDVSRNTQDQEVVIDPTVRNAEASIGNMPEPNLEIDFPGMNP